jgi:uncharacterized SAM-binding protein YcdF (DUF218 family)
MELGLIKPVLKALALPPTSLLLLGLLGLILVWRKKALGKWLSAASLAGLWWLSCNAVALWLSSSLVPPPPPAKLEFLRESKVQAVVILGGGVDQNVPEYGGLARLSDTSARRLHYGLMLANQLQVPVAFTAGIGWLAQGEQDVTEAQVARRQAYEEYGVRITWSEDRSRDTVENAQLITPMLRRDGVSRIVLVTHAWHMPRALAAFKGQPLTVIPAGTDYLGPAGPLWREWLPSPGGLRNSSIVLHEWLGLLVSPS